MEMQLLRELLSSADHRQALLSPPVAPALVGVGQPGMLMEKPAKPASDRGGHEREKQKAHREENELRHDRDQDPDGAEDEEENRERQVPRLVAPDPRFAADGKFCGRAHGRLTVSEAPICPRAVSFAGSERTDSADVAANLELRLVAHTGIEPVFQP